MEQTDANGNGEPEQEALFEIEIDDDDGCVWIVIGKGAEAETRNLGPVAAVFDKWVDVMAHRDFGED